MSDLLTTPNCRRPGANPENWWPSRPGQVITEKQHEAAQLCADCPTRNACARLALGLKHGASGGIWGGIYIPVAGSTGDRRAAIARLSAIAAPRLEAKAAPAKRHGGGRAAHNTGRCLHTDCGIPLVSKRDRRPPAGMRRHGGHGLCEACYVRERRCAKAAA